MNPILDDNNNDVPCISMGYGTTTTLLFQDTIHLHVCCVSVVVVVDNDNDLSEKNVYN